MHGLTSDQQPLGRHKYVALYRGEKMSQLTRIKLDAYKRAVIKLTALESAYTDHNLCLLKQQADPESGDAL